MCFGFLKKKKAAKKESKVCIPEHAKERLEKQAEQRTVTERKSEKEKEINDFVVKKSVSGTVNIFRVTGRYDSASETMLSGIVESGSIREKMKATVNGNEIKVSEIRMGSQKIGELNFMEEGTLSLKGKNSQSIKYDTLIEFQP